VELNLKIMEEIVNIRLKVPKKLNQKIDLRLVQARGLNIKTTKEKFIINLINAGISAGYKK
jgi:hypothetical protein